MKWSKKFLWLTSVFGLALAMLFSVGAAAVGEDTRSPAELRQEDLNFLYENLKTYHPDLFANTPEEIFLGRKAQIETRLPTESDTDFVLDLQSMAALIHDSHTQVSINSIVNDTGYYPFMISWMNGQWILDTVEADRQDLLGAQVLSMNGLTMDQVLERFSGLISADNPIKLRRQFRQACNVEALYQYAGIVSGSGELLLTLRDDSGRTHALTLNAVDSAGIKSLSLASLKEKRAGFAVTDYDKSKYYFAVPLSGSTYYIQYNTCQEDPALPMDTFCSQVKTALDTGGYPWVFVDLRNNGGGSDGVLYPLLTLLRREMDSNGLRVAALIGETTFSSAIINAVELQEMGAVLAGEATSGSVDHFGSAGGFKLPNSGIQVQVSSKLISLSTLFDAAAGKGVESLVPDVEINQTLTDYLAGRDTCVDRLLEDPSCLQPAADGDSPLTRGRFIGMLYQALGSPVKMQEQPPFQDLLGIEWNLPALNWAAEEKIALGTGNGRFSGAKYLSWQEAAVFLDRSAEAFGIVPREATAAKPPEALLDGAWDRGSIDRVWKWGLLPRTADFSGYPTRTQGETIIEALLQAR